jgi:hypothetical protein
MSAIGYGLDNAVIPGQDVSRLIRSGAFAYVPVSNYYRSLAALVNPTNAPQSVQLRWIGGGSSGPLNMDLPANSGLSVDLPVLMGIAYPGAGTPVSGAVQIAVLNGPGVLGYLLIRSEDFRLMAALPLESGGAPVHLFPQLAQAQDYWTGISLANPAEVFSDVTVTAYNSQGITVGSYARRLSPGELHLGLLFQWIAKSMGLSTGWIEVRSSNPVLASEIFGSEALSFINAISGRNP